MDDKLNQAGDTAVNTPVSTTDQATRERSEQAPSASADQGVGTATAETTDDTAAQDTAQNEAERNGSLDETAEAVTGLDDASVQDAADSSAEPTPASDEGDAAQASVQTSAEEAPTEEVTTEASANTASGEVSADAAGVSDVGVNDTVDDSGNNMTMEEVMAASDEQLARKPIHRGTLTNGTVIMLSQDGLVVDVGAKIEGLVPYNQLFEFEADAQEAAKYFKPGDELQVYAIRVDIPNNTIILSKKRADQERAWNLLQDIYDKNLPVEVEIVEKVRGGLVANLGVRAFLPASQVDVRRVNDLAPYVGKRLKVRIIELNRKRNRVIISRRSIIEEEVAEQKEATLRQLEPGAKLEGEVVEITDFGAFVNLGGIDGLVHRSEISYGRFNHPKEVLEVGQKVKVEVLDMDLERERINLSMKSLRSDPWENVLANYSIGQKVAGKVTNLTPFGAFVEIESGLEGLIHVSEMSWTKRIRHPKEVLEEGEDVEAMILKIDVAQQRISLGLRQTQPDPWSSLPDRFPPGTEVTGPITGLTEFGVFMELEEGIEGLIHISELAHEHIDDVSQHFSRGDEVTAVVLNIDPIEQRASLSRKRLLPFSAGDDIGTGAPSGAPSNRGGRKGRRGGRRSQGIDYDYSYAATDSGAKTTTKLGDVYADLFAQFGLGDTASSDNENEKSEEGPQAQEQSAMPDTQPSTEPLTAEVEEVAEVSEEELEDQVPAQADAESDTQDAQSDTQQAETQPQQAEQTQTSSSESEEEDPENAIDAAEAAAMLTAAFRQGRRPAQQEQDSQEQEAEKETSEA